MALDFSKLSILIVEDTEPMRKVIDSVLRTLGVKEIYKAANGEEGFREFCRKNPDIVIADWEMSPMNGIALTQAIRTSALSPNRMAPIILMTGYTAASRVGAAGILAASAPSRSTARSPSTSCMRTQRGSLPAPSGWVWWWRH